MSDEAIRPRVEDPLRPSGAGAVRRRPQCRLKNRTQALVIDFVVAAWLALIAILIAQL